MFPELDPALLEELKKEQENSAKLMSTISNIITYIIYVFLLVSLATTMNGQQTYYQKNQVERLVGVRAAETDRQRKREREREEKLTTLDSGLFC